MEPKHCHLGCFLDTGAVRIRQLDSLYFKPLGRTLRSESADAWGNIYKNSPTLEKLDISAGSSVTFITEDNNKIRIYSNGPGFKGRLIVNDSGLIEAGTESFEVDTVVVFQLDGADEMLFWASGTDLGGLDFAASLSDSILISGIEVSNLEFTRLDLSDEDLDKLKSSIDHGVITLPEISRTVEIHSGEILSFKGLEGTLVELKVANTIELYFVGRANEVMLGPKGFDRELTPTLLETVYYGEKWILLFSAMMFIFGIFRRVKES
jgi:hypothetical protein